MIDLNKIRNIAVIAHVDHGKTTIIDSLIKSTSNIRSMVDRAMDKNDLEKERGITILSKHTSIKYKDYSINIMDTPGHVDFGGEVERVMDIVDGVMLLVDAKEGPMAQTKFVLEKAIKKNLKIIVVINKMDRPDARYESVENEVMELLDDLKSEEIPTFLYAVGRDGWVSKTPTPTQDINDLLDTIIEEIPVPSLDNRFEEDSSFLCSIIEKDKFLSKAVTGKVYSGEFAKNEKVSVLKPDGSITQSKILKVSKNFGVENAEIDKCIAGDIVTLYGIDCYVGDTIIKGDKRFSIPSSPIDPTTISVAVMSNKSPNKGLEGTKVNFRDIKEYLLEENQFNVSIDVEDCGQFLLLKGRGELQISIIIENMRRLGFELSITKPVVIFKHEDGVKLEPVEEVKIEVNKEFQNIVMEKLNRKKGICQAIEESSCTKRISLMFKIPTRCLFGYQRELISDTKGSGVMSRRVLGYEPHFGNFGGRIKGIILSVADGLVSDYSLNKLDSRGSFFVENNDCVYKKMIVGESSTENNIEVNLIKTKPLTNMRVSGTEEKMSIKKPRKFGLEDCMGFIEEGECIDITPKTIKMRKE